MNRNDERGEGRLGLLVAVIVVGVAIFVGAKVIPVRITAYEFRDVLRQEARMGAVRDSDGAVRQRIMRQAKELEIPLEKMNLDVRRTQTKIIITARYEVPIDLKVTTYIYKFDVTERAPLF